MGCNYFLSPSGNRHPLVFCNVKGTEETDLPKSAEDTIVNRMEAEKVVRLSILTFTVCLMLVRLPKHFYIYALYATDGDSCSC